MTAIMSLPFTARLVDRASTFMLGSRLKISYRIRIKEQKVEQGTAVSRLVLCLRSKAICMSVPHVHKRSCIGVGFPDGHCVGHVDRAAGSHG
jgi:hypothetical protein